MTAVKIMASAAGFWILTLTVLAGAALDPVKPDRGNDEWRMRHGERVADVRNNADNLEMLFIGDSITGGWLNLAKTIWEKEFVPLHAVNIGIAGSQTSHILWQFESGAIDGIRPRVAVLMIGVNNVVASPSHSAADIARGISTIVARLREKLPNTRILLLATFPKDRAPDTSDRRKIQESNALIAKLDDGKWIRFLDISDRLLDKDGNLNADVSPDGVHLTMKGYQIWAEAIGPVLQEMRVQEPPPNGVPAPSPIPPKAIDMRDNGEGTGKMLEIRTSGYEHAVAAINGMAVDYLQQVADWCRERGDAKADAFQAAARRLHDEIERHLWDESAGWYINLYPDGSRHRVMSYHVFDLLPGLLGPVNLKTAQILTE